MDEHIGWAFFQDDPGGHWDAAYGPGWSLRVEYCEDCLRWRAVVLATGTGARHEAWLEGGWNDPGPAMARARQLADTLTVSHESLVP